MRTHNQNKHAFEGGWIFPAEGKISFYSGSLGEVTDKDSVKDAIEATLRVHLEDAR